MSEDGSHRESSVSEKYATATLTPLSPLRFTVSDLIKVCIQVVSAALILFAAVWKVGQYFQSLTDEISGLRADIVSVKEEIKAQQNHNSTFNTRIGLLELDKQVRDAINKITSDNKEEVKK